MNVKFVDWDFVVSWTVCKVRGNETVFGDNSQSFRLHEIVPCAESVLKT
jgi:hypothetical protein